MKKIGKRLEKRISFLRTENIFENESVLKMFCEGEILLDNKAFFVALIDFSVRHKTCEFRLSDFTQETFGSGYGSQKWEDCIPYCLGLQATYPDKIQAGFTHDLEKITLIK